MKLNRLTSLLLGLVAVGAMARMASSIDIGMSSAVKAVGKNLEEKITAPATPSGSSSGIRATAYQFTSGGAVSNRGHAVQYRFDWGDGTHSDWSATAVATHAWTSVGTFKVKAEARCCNHTDVASSSAEFSFGIVNSTPNAPAQPTGPSTGTVSAWYTWTAVAADADGDQVRLGWDWNNDGTAEEWSGLLNSGTPENRPHMWATPGTYTVKVKADDSLGLSSAWSPTLSVIIHSRRPTTPAKPGGPGGGLVSASHTFTTSPGATDPDGDQIRYGWDWNGDGTTDEWSAYVLTGTADSRGYTWTTSGTYLVKVIAQDSYGELSLGWSSATTMVISSRAPSIPTQPSGALSATINAISTYTTSATDPDGDQVRYGWDWDGDGIVDKWSALMASGATDSRNHAWATPATYSVQVKAEDAYGVPSSGWSTARSVYVFLPVDVAPNTPSQPSGAGTGNVGSSYTYTTLTTDPDVPPDQVRYGWDWNGDGTVDEWSGLMASGATDSRSHIWSSATTYSVQVTAEDEHGLPCLPTWSTAKSVVISSVCNVGIPSQPSGAASGVLCGSYAYTTAATDPEGDQIRYGWDWDGNGTVDEWSTFVASGTTDNRSHAWSSAATYSVKVRDEDSKACPSGWSTVKSVVISSISLGAAVDNALLTWSTGGAANWFGEACAFYSGGDAAQSGDISDNQSTYMEATVTGPGTLSFYWKVDSENNYDYLTLLVDGTPQSGPICGSVNWTYKDIGVAAGAHTLRWQYSKDGSVSNGADAAWLDLVVFDATEVVTSPTSPEGNTSVAAGTTYTYATGGAVSSLAHSVQYRFNWGDGTYSSWASGTTASHSWVSAGTYTVQAEARCASDTGVTSSSATTAVSAGTFSATANWVQMTASAGFTNKACAQGALVFNNKMWVIGGYDESAVLDEVYSSPDGVTWTQVTATAAFGNRYDQECVAFNGKMWTIAGYDGSAYRNDVWWSTDGVTWTQATASAAFPVRGHFIALVYSGKMWVIGGGNSGGALNDVWSSSDGVTWTQVTSNGGFGGQLGDGTAGVVFNNKLWAFGGAGSGCSNPIWYSTDGVTWTQSTSNAPYGSVHAYRAAVYRGKMLVTGGTNSGVRDSDTWYSTDGVTWTQMTGTNYSPGRASHSFVIFNDKMWVYGGNQNPGNLSDVWANPVAAETVSAPMAPDGNTSVAAGTTYTYNTGSSTSSLGHSVQYRFNWGDSTYSSWSSGTSGSHSWSSAGTYNVQAEARCSSDTGVTSTSGTVVVAAGTFSASASWVQVTGSAGFTNKACGHGALAYGGKLWVIGGYDESAVLDEVYSSPDGVTWTQVTAAAAFGTRGFHECLSFNGKMWLIAGYDGAVRRNDVWYSTDGNTWTQATANAGFPVRDGFIALVYAGKMWVIGGSTAPNDVWSSPDGVTWTQVTADGGFSSQLTDGPAGVVFNNKMWAFGGAGSGCQNPVWYSTDGVTWTQATANAPYGSVHAYRAAVYRGKMLVTGGTNSGVRDSDTWYSTDGATWTNMTGTHYSPGRASHSFVIFNDKMWVYGGNQNPGNLSDVWRNP